MTLTIEQFPPPAKTYTMRDRLHQQLPQRAARQWSIFIGLAMQGKFGNDVRELAKAFDCAPSPNAAGAMIALNGPFVQWSEDDAARALEASGLLPLCADASQQAWLEQRKQ